MALFALILVGIVVAQTWLDWRDEKKSWVVPDWAKGIALGGVVAVSLAAATSTASVWLREGAGQWTSARVHHVAQPAYDAVIERTREQVLAIKTAAPRAAPPRT